MYRKYIFYISGLLILLAFFHDLFIAPPADFPVGVVVKIEQGASLRSVSRELKNEHIILSRTAFEAFAIMYGGDRHIISTDYYFENKLPVYEVARRISRGEHKMAPISVTIPEGFENNQIADAISLKLMNFDKKNFLTEAKNMQGYLFPDTYFFLTTDTATEVIKSMNGNFKKKIAPLSSQITSSEKTEKDIIIMASVIEHEAEGDTDRGIISGILWKRISIGMPLQVDAAPETYKNKGLPKIPIGNPGLEAINAAINPQKSAYLYYLHDKNGVVHYAKSLADHNSNIRKYLK